MQVFTIGHSTRPFETLRGLLVLHGIEAVADVRRYPASRRHPQFAREALADALGSAGIGYEWFEALGGRRPRRPDSPHVAWRSAAFRGYADHMDTEEFARALNRLMAFAARQPTAIMCAEAVPWRCHRQLVADALVARGADVAHVTSSATPSPHRLPPFARLDGERVVYDQGQLDLPGASRA